MTAANINDYVYIIPFLLFYNEQTNTYMNGVIIYIATPKRSTQNLILLQSKVNGGSVTVKTTRFLHQLLLLKVWVFAWYNNGGLQSMQLKAVHVGKMIDVLHNNWRGQLLPKQRVWTSIAVMMWHYRNWDVIPFVKNRFFISVWGWWCRSDIESL